MNRNKPGTRLVYTSDPEEAKRLREESQAVVVRDAIPGEQTVRVAIDRKRGKGRAVTVAKGFRLTAPSLEKLATTLKKRCVAGGSSEGDEIVIQGEKVELVAELLAGFGYRVKKS